MTSSKTENRRKALFVAYLPQTPFGTIGLAASETDLAFLDLHADPKEFEAKLHAQGFTLQRGESFILLQAMEQLQAYFSRSRKIFDLPIDWQRFTPFQERVLRATLAIPYGQVKTYAEIAQEIGNPRATRAVGRAEAHNPLPIVIPCHRVISSRGSLRGYSAPGGIETKARLLRLEGLTLI
ncbi:MAG: methylated-DNA--[protein]-cysteine S-methyltransferase [Anaerolineales bacterium]|nr:methylated-DNA--[protein]-cysteine S-methyltransferase [Anaerolineales bacterium]MCS7246978.1 methylated-DNA--[protein]-cysteine S-methyltransferase [Anaerolineales bacterium]MDW8160789.1 methylated-DNA--[protein]-cysteine S-methyltransferase [Anaerolineales bacterium]MDW8447772.1 methylated-DNA--[protein]-cysteine S-methyltransferase [Anaerolineales bacterium]